MSALKLLPPHANGVTLNLEELLQYRTQSVRWLPPAQSIWSQMSGNHTSRQKGRGMDFMEVRQYQAGDDIRSIDWRVTARTGKAHTKLFAEDKEQAVILYIDLSPSMHFGSQYVLKSVQLAHFASVLIWLTLAKKDRIGAVIDDGQKCIEFRPSSLQKQALRILDAIVNTHNQLITNQQVESVRHLPYESAIEALHNLAPKGSELILLSDFVQMEEKEFLQLRRLKQHNSVRAVQFYDPLERGETDYRGQAKASDGQRSQWFNFGSKGQRKELESYFLKRQQSVKQQCHSMAIPFNSLSSGSPLIPQLS
ncbi:DUF58 domain-containing protein [Vibrio alfacsensis]|uniref:DUF58 domain-containing protein n=1 Tax=Vibrio alfacsensis TaxID=1074311 RepID=A0ABN5PK77_9VIBR|nr:MULTISPECIES: DUF58 domain-containing protein [Vibrio]AXY02767.1 DUF58 domain-containing protein [Vibrio alfacsensis]CAE6930643.1 hypothetical protein ACOMICROBIO_GDFFDHBD_02574 [Vibrio sp. B1REV9]